VKEDLPQPKFENDNYCIICALNPKDCVFSPCGHKVVCNACGKSLKNRFKDVCPICRQKIKDVVKVYDI